MMSGNIPSRQLHPLYPSNIRVCIIENQSGRFGEKGKLFSVKWIDPRYFVLAACVVWAIADANRLLIRWKLWQISWLWVSLNKPTVIILPRKVLQDENLTNTSVFKIPSTRLYPAQFIPDHNFTTYFAYIHFNIDHPYLLEATPCLEWYHTSEAHIATCYTVKHAWQRTSRLFFCCRDAPFNTGTFSMCLRG
jgi:hypothetical protein